MPIPVCRRARAKRCTNVRGAQYAGKCDAKAEPYFGWKLHLICDSAGISVRHGLRLVPPHHPIAPTGRHATAQGIALAHGINPGLVVAPPR